MAFRPQPKAPPAALAKQQQIERAKCRFFLVKYRLGGRSAWTAAGEAAVEPPCARSTLVHVSAYFRHGARAPLFALDSDVVRGRRWDTCGEAAALSAAIDGGADAVVRLVDPAS